MELVRRKLQVLVGVCPGVCAIAVLLEAIAGSARAHAPCSYEISHVLDLPDCPFGLNNGIDAFGISPNGRYVAGNYGDCTEYVKPCVYDTQTNQLIPIPLPAGFTDGHAADVNDSGLAAVSVAGPDGGLGFIFDIVRGDYVVQIPPLVETGACELTAINAQGAVCGNRTFKGEPDYLRSAFIWTPDNGGMVTDLGLINGQSTLAEDLNDGGWVTGQMASPDVFGSVAFLWRGNEFIELPTLLDGYEAFPLSINNRLEVVGKAAAVPIPGLPFGLLHAARWSKGIVIDLGLLPADNRSSASDISDTGVIIGTSSPAQGHSTAVIWDEDRQMHTLGDLFDHEEYPVIMSPIAIAATGRIVILALDLDFDLITLLVSPVEHRPGDTNADCVVNMDDLLAVINHWGQAKSTADLNHDGIVGVADLLTVIENWTVF